VTPRAVAITGAAGFIGRHLCDAFDRKGWEVRALVRRPESRRAGFEGMRVAECELPDRIDEEGLAGAAAVIHCAYVTRHRDLAEARRVNDLGTRRLLAASRAASVRKFVFISSQSAHEGALSYYGRSKRALESLLGPDDLIIRPGLVLGGGEAGLFARMSETMRGARVVPLFGGGRQPLQTVHVDDLCDAITTAVERDLGGVLTIAEPEPIEMGAFLRALAARLGRRPLFVPFPITPALALLRLIEAVRLPFPVSSENLLGLRQMQRSETAPDLRKVGVIPRSAVQSLEEIFPA